MMAGQQPSNPLDATGEPSAYDPLPGQVDQPVAAMLVRIQQVMLARGFGYLDNGQPRLWPMCAVAMGNAKHRYVIAPWIDGAEHWAAELVRICNDQYGPAGCCVFVGAGGANNQFLRQLLQSETGWVGYVDTSTGQVHGSAGARWYCACPPLARTSRLRELLDLVRANMGQDIDCRRAMRHAADQENERETFVRALQGGLNLPRVTPLIVGACVAIMAVVSLQFMQGSNSALQDWAGSNGPLVKAGQYWRLLTPMFMHVNLIHLAFNMYVLWSAGQLYERLQGSSRFVAVYLFAGLAGVVGSLLYHPTIFSMGASGAIFGVYGALAAMLLRYRQHLPEGVRRAFLNGVIAFIGYNLAFGFMLRGFVDNAAQVGGLAGGFLMGLALATKPLTRTGWQGWQKLAGLLLTAALAGGAWQAIVRSPAVIQPQTSHQATSQPTTTQSATDQSAPAEEAQPTPEENTPHDQPSDEQN